MSETEKDPAELVRGLVEAVVDALELDAEVTVTQEDGAIRCAVDGDDLGPLIGRGGQTIDALQHLAYRAAAAQGVEPRPSVEVDAGGYREKRAEALRRSADQAAERAMASGRPVPLEPMNAVERKYVHEYLRDRTGFETHSEGEEPDRRLVITAV